MKFIKTTVALLLFSAMVFSQQEKIRVACIGNSITWGGWGNVSYPAKLQKKLGANFDVRNFGVSARTLLRKGDYPYWVEPEFLQAREFNPHIVIIKLGTNDSKPQNWIYKNEFFSDYMDLVSEFRKLGRRPVIYVCFPVPVYKTNWGINDSTVNKMIPLIDSVYKTAKTFLIDFNTPLKNRPEWFSDGVHPDPPGYEFMAQIVYDTLINGQSGVIQNFYAQKNELHKNESTTLFWNLSKNSNATLNGVLIKDVDSLIVSPTQTTTYNLKTNGAYKDSVLLTVKYFPPGKIKSFYSIPKYFEKGIIDTVQLFWKTGTGSAVMLNGIMVESNGEKFVTQKNALRYSLTANGDVNDSISIDLPEVEELIYNRALYRNVTAFSTEWGFSPNDAVDGSLESMWKSGYSSSQYFTVEMKKSYDIKKIILHWGKTFGTRYSLISLHEDGTATSIYNTDNGDGGIDTINILSGVSKSLRLFCLKSNIPNKPYELLEFEIYGSRNLLSVKDELSLPLKFILQQNFPNPFNPITTIPFSIPQNFSGSMVSLKVYDVLGREVSVVLDKKLAPGKYEVQWEAKNISSGIYFYQLSANGFAETKKFILQK